ncbi:MAG: hypothetical protein FWH57_10295 [Oscillospiraceae bacterium]|nr:hypothetical protein [Oscillospiraceae bacterium]
MSIGKVPPSKVSWDKENTVYIGLKLMRKGDADILSALAPNKPKQTQIKAWIRKALEQK